MLTSGELLTSYLFLIAIMIAIITLLVSAEPPMKKREEPDTLSLSFYLTNRWTFLEFLIVYPGLFIATINSLMENMCLYCFVCVFFTSGLVFCFFTICGIYYSLIGLMGQE